LSDGISLYPDAPKTAGSLAGAMIVGRQEFSGSGECGVVGDSEDRRCVSLTVVPGLHVGALAYFLYWWGSFANYRDVGGRLCCWRDFSLKRGWWSSGRRFCERGLMIGDCGAGGFFFLPAAGKF